MDTPAMTPENTFIEKQEPEMAPPPRPRRMVRHWPDEEKRRIVEETLLPGMSVSIVARRHDVNANVVFTWRKRYREGRLGGRTEGPGFVRVGVVGGTLRALPAALDRPHIEVELSGGMKVRIDAGIEEHLLRRVLRALKSCA
jgi:transposase